MGDAIAAAELVPHQDVIHSFASPLKPERRHGDPSRQSRALSAVIKHSAASPHLCATPAELSSLTASKTSPIALTTNLDVTAGHILSYATPVPAHPHARSGLIFQFL